MSRKEELIQEINQKLHGIQTGIRYKYETSEKDESLDRRLKHIRVGVDNALIQTDTLMQLLVKKGVFTDIEWLEEYLQAVNFKLNQYKKELSEALGVPVNLI